MLSLTSDSRALHTIGLFPESYNVLSLSCVCLPFIADCAVCEDGYSAGLAHTCMRCSASKRQGIMAASVVAAFLAVCATAATFRYLLSLEFEETNLVSFHRKVHQAFPLQAFKTVIVVWQILTQVSDSTRFERCGETRCETYPHSLLQCVLCEMGKGSF